MAFRVLIHISGSLYSHFIFWFHSRKEFQFTLHVYIFAGIGSGLHCWQILIFTHAYVLTVNFHTSSCWVLILAAEGPYWVLHFTENGSFLIKSISQGLGVLLSFEGSEVHSHSCIHIQNTCYQLFTLACNANSFWKSNRQKL